MGKYLHNLCQASIQMIQKVCILLTNMTDRTTIYSVGNPAHDADNAVFVPFCWDEERDVSCCRFCVAQNYYLPVSIRRLSNRTSVSRARTDPQTKCCSQEQCKSLVCVPKTATTAPQGRLLVVSFFFACWSICCVACCLLQFAITSDAQASTGNLRTQRLYFSTAGAHSPPNRYAFTVVYTT